MHRDPVATPLSSSASHARPGADDPASDAARAVTALRRLVRALRTSTRRAERAPAVTSAQLLVLRELGGAPGMSLGALARRTHTSQSTVSEVVARLVESGFIRRRVAADDGRRRELSLTARGRAAVHRAPRSAGERLREALEGMPPARRRAVAAGLEGWIAAAGLEVVEPTLFLARETRNGHGSRRSG